MDIDTRMLRAKSLAHRLSYIKTRKEHGLSAYELEVTVPTEEFIELAEAYIELAKQEAQNKTPP